MRVAICIPDLHDPFLQDGPAQPTFFLDQRSRRVMVVKDIKIIGGAFDHGKKFLAYRLALLVGLHRRPTLTLLIDFFETNCHLSLSELFELNFQKLGTDSENLQLL